MPRRNAGRHQQHARPVVRHACHRMLKILLAKRLQLERQMLCIYQHAMADMVLPCPHST